MDGLGGSQDLRRRGATHIDLIVTDGHDGLLAAVSELFSATPRQRSLVHKQRKVTSTIPRRERAEVADELVGIWQQRKPTGGRGPIGGEHSPNMASAIQKRCEAWPKRKRRP